MEISTINSAIAATSGTAGTTSSTESVIASDFETFLQMLTAQAKYQDPLEPMDSSEYASQLAQFSSVEQQVLTNDLLQDMSSQLSQNGLVQYSDWIGQDIRSVAPMAFDGAPIDLTLTPIAAAEAAELVVYNVLGEEVQRLPIDKDAREVTWAGVQENGTPFEADLYSFAVESFANDNRIATTQLETYARVLETRLENGQTLLVLNGGAIVDPTLVTAVRGAS